MSVNKDLAFNELEIRDTNDHTSVEINNGDFVIKTLIIQNSLNQAVTFQCQGSAEASFDNPFDIGSTWDVTANTNTYQTCDAYIPYWRIIASCASAPSSGSLTIFVMGVES